MAETSGLPAQFESEIITTKTLGTKCHHCGQKFSEESFHIAIFLYGIFFLVGREIGYAGMTCPRCLKTIFHKNSREAILSLKQMLGSMIILGDCTIDPQLRYYSSLGGSPIEIRLIGAFDIQHLDHQTGIDAPPSLSDRIMTYQEENPELEENYMRSYINDENDLAGAFCHVWWINNDDVEKLVQLENINGIKVFPRYYHNCALIEDVDRFCWKNGYFNIYLEKLKNCAVSEQERIEQELIRQGIDFKDVIEKNSNIVNPRVIEWIQSENQSRNADEILNVAGDFLKILIADPEPWGIQSSISQLCKGFWKTKNPFTTVVLPLSLSKFSPHPFKETAESQWLYQAKEDILQEFTTPDVQEYLMKNYASFIREYAEIINEKVFSYADLWCLKEKYLKELHSLVKEQKKIKNKNLFYRKNGFWVVSYNENETLVQNLDGMAYIHFLLQNKGKPFTYFEIDKLLNGEIARAEGKDDKVKDESKLFETGYVLFLTRQDMITKEQLDQALQEKEKVLEKMQIAEDIGNEDVYSELNSYLEKIDMFIKESTYTVKKGKKVKIKIKRFRNSSAYKIKKDNVDRVLKYALSSLEEHNEAAYKHLNSSIRNKRGEIWYEPEVDTDWYTG
jgi:hypothetical protein